MNKKDLIDYYNIHMPSHLRPYTRQAIEFYFLANPGAELFDYKNIHGIQRIALSLHDWEKKKTTAVPELNFYPGMFIAAEKRIKYILPEVKKIREELFRTQEAPFNYDKAIEWLRKEAKKERDDFYKKNQEAQKDILKYDRIPIKADPLGPDVDEIITFPGTKLRKLFNVINWYSQDTYFSQFSLLMFILTGIKPILPSYSIKKEITSVGRRVELKLFRPFNQKEFIKLFKPIEEFMSRKKKLKGKGIKVYEFIEEIGFVPSKNKMRFWEEALSQWNKKYPKEKYANESSLRMAYTRTKKRVKSL